MYVFLSIVIITILNISPCLIIQSILFYLYCYNDFFLKIKKQIFIIIAIIMLLFFISIFIFTKNLINKKNYICNKEYFVLKEALTNMNTNLIENNNIIKIFNKISSIVDENNLFDSQNILYLLKGIIASCNEKTYDFLCNSLKLDEVYYSIYNIFTFNIPFDIKKYKQYNKFVYEIHQLIVNQNNINSEIVKQTKTFDKTSQNIDDLPALILESLFIEKNILDYIISQKTENLLHKFVLWKYRRTILFYFYISNFDLFFESKDIFNYMNPQIDNKINFLGIFLYDMNNDSLQNSLTCLSECLLLNQNDIKEKNINSNNNFIISNDINADLNIDIKKYILFGEQETKKHTLELSMNDNIDNKTIDWNIVNLTYFIIQLLNLLQPNLYSNNNNIKSKSYYLDSNNYKFDNYFIINIFNNYNNKIFIDENSNIKLLYKHNKYIGNNNQKLITKNNLLPKYNKNNLLVKKINNFYDTKLEQKKQNIIDNQIEIVKDTKNFVNRAITNVIKYKKYFFIKLIKIMLFILINFNLLILLNIIFIGNKLHNLYNILFLNIIFVSIILLEFIYIFNFFSFLCNIYFTKIFFKIFYIL